METIQQREAVRYGNIIAAELKRRDITLGLMARITGISKSHLSLIRRGKRTPSPETAKKIAGFLRTPLKCEHCGSTLWEDE